MADPAQLLALRGIDKSFDGVVALSNVDFSLDAGSVHALLGENGAGKSTLIKIITGAYQATAGTIELEGRPVVFRSPEDALAQGVAAVHQEVSVLLHRSVAENLFLGREPSRWGFLDRKAMNRSSRALLDELGLDIDPRATLATLPIAARQMIAILRGTSLRPKVLILDEPTSSLPPASVKSLFELIGRLRSQGTGIVYISHRFDEIDAICDTVTVLRDGKCVASRPLTGVRRVELVSLMLGKDRAELEHDQPGIPREQRESAAEQPVVLRVEHLARAPSLRDVSFEARRREIVGLSGLLGSGRTETVRAVFGAEPAERGKVSVNQRPLEARSPRDGVRAGLALLPEDRGQDGIVPDLSLRENLTLAVLLRLSRLGVVARGKERALVDEFIRRLRIKASSAEQRMRELSGGNQQKVLLARWLCRRPEVLLLDEPTRGIDVGAKAEIHELIEKMSASGLTVVMISSELEELVERCSRIFVLREGRSVAELAGDAVGAHSIIDAMAGRGDPPSEVREP